MSPLLFIIALEALLRECLPWEVLYTDEFGIITETLGQRMRYAKIVWKAKSLG